MTNLQYRPLDHVTDSGVIDPESIRSNRKPYRCMDEHSRNVEFHYEFAPKYTHLRLH